MNLFNFIFCECYFVCLCDVFRVTQSYDMPRVDDPNVSDYGRSLYCLLFAGDIDVNHNSYTFEHLSIIL